MTNIHEWGLDHILNHIRIITVIQYTNINAASIHPLQFKCRKNEGSNSDVSLWSIDRKGII